MPRWNHVLRSIAILYGMRCNTSSCCLRVFLSIVLTFLRLLFDLPNKLLFSLSKPNIIKLNCSSENLQIFDCVRLTCLRNISQTSSGSRVRIISWNTSLSRSSCWAFFRYFMLLLIMIITISTRTRRLETTPP